MATIIVKKCAFPDCSEPRGKRNYCTAHQETQDTNEVTSLPTKTLPIPNGRKPPPLPKTFNNSNSNPSMTNNNFKNVKKEEIKERDLFTMELSAKLKNKDKNETKEKIDETVPSINKEEKNELLKEECNESVDRKETKNIIKPKPLNMKPAAPMTFKERENLKVKEREREKEKKESEKEKDRDMLEKDKDKEKFSEKDIEKKEGLEKEIEVEQVIIVNKNNEEMEVTIEKSFVKDLNEETETKSTPRKESETPQQKGKVKFPKPLPKPNPLTSLPPPPPTQALPISFPVKKETENIVESAFEVKKENVINVNVSPSFEVKNIEAIINKSGDEGIMQIRVSSRKKRLSEGADDRKSQKIYLAERVEESNDIVVKEDEKARRRKSSFAILAKNDSTMKKDGETKREGEGKKKIPNLALLRAQVSKNTLPLTPPPSLMNIADNKEKERDKDIKRERELNIEKLKEKLLVPNATEIMVDLLPLPVPPPKPKARFKIEKDTSNSNNRRTSMDDLLFESEKREKNAVLDSERPRSRSQNSIRKEKDEVTSSNVAHLQKKSSMPVIPSMVKNVPPPFKKKENNIKNTNNISINNISNNNNVDLNAVPITWIPQQKTKKIPSPWWKDDEFVAPLAAVKKNVKKNLKEIEEKLEGVDLQAIIATQAAKAINNMKEEFAKKEIYFKGKNPNVLNVNPNNNENVTWKTNNPAKEKMLDEYERDDGERMGSSENLSKNTFSFACDEIYSYKPSSSKKIAICIDTLTLNVVSNDGTMKIYYLLDLIVLPPKVYNEDKSIFRFSFENKESNAKKEKTFKMKSNINKDEITKMIKQVQAIGLLSLKVFDFLSDRSFILNFEKFKMIMMTCSIEMGEDDVKTFSSLCPSVGIILSENKNLDFNLFQSFFIKKRFFSLQ